MKYVTQYMIESAAVELILAQNYNQENLIVRGTEIIFPEWAKNNWYEACKSLLKISEHYKADTIRLDWLLENKRALGPEQCLRDCKHTNYTSYQLIYTRRTIDEEIKKMMTYE